MKHFFRRLKAAFTFFSFLIALTPLAAEEKTGGGYAITGQGHSSGYAYTLYDATNGLATSDANTILSTSDGFIWIGGYIGLTRYDGTSFVRQEYSSSITNANTLLEDSRGRLWIGMNENGVVMVDRGQQHSFSYAQGFRSTAIRTLAEARDGTIYIGTTQGLMYIDTGMNVHFLDDKRINNAYIIRLVSDHDGSVYGNTRNGDFFCINNQTLSIFYGKGELGIGSITTVYPDPHQVGAVFLGTDSSNIYHGIVTQTGSRLDRISVAPASAVRWITYASQRIWAVSETTAGYLDTDGSFVVLKDFPITSGLGELIEDYEGNIWISSFRHGVVKLVANQFADLGAKAGLGKLVVNSTCIHQGLLYAGTDQGLKIISREGKLLTSEVTAFIGNSRVRCLMEDPDGNLWISVYGDQKGLICLSPSGRIQSYQEKDGLLSNWIRCTARSATGEIFVGTNGGLNIIKDGRITARYGTEEGLSSTVILTVCAGAGGNDCYVGTDGGGIYIIDGENVFHKGRADGLQSEVILRIKYDEERDVFWIITSNSIAFMKDERITTIQHFPYPNTYDIYFSADGNAWIPASNGIYVAKADDLLKNGSFNYLFYDSSNGLPSMPTGNAFSALDSDGNLFLSCRTGPCQVNIDHYFESTPSIKLTIPYVEADGRRYYPTAEGSITLPVQTKTLTIYGYALTYSLQNPKIQHFLAGVDKRPSHVDKKSMEPVRYTNLAGGSYTYELAMLNNATNQVQQKTTLTIIKEKAVVEQLWFRIVLAIAGLLALAFCVQLYIGNRMRKMEKKAEEDRAFTNAIIGAFANCVDGKDVYTNGHSERVAKYTRLLAEALGENAATVEKFYNIARLHDIGKISIPDAILKKPAKLSDEEFAIMKSHAQRGYEILKDVKLQEDLADGAHYHHERFDGKGYPDGLSGDAIPWVARIIAVADTFDAMSSTRPYRKSLPLEVIVKEIQDCAGSQFDPAVVAAFMNLYEAGAFDDLKAI